MRSLTKQHFLSTRAQIYNASVIDTAV